MRSSKMIKVARQCMEINVLPSAEVVRRARETNLAIVDRLSPGTLYPMLHKMRWDGYLTCREERHGRSVRKLYRITDLGREGLALAKKRVREFTGEAMTDG